LIVSVAVVMSVDGKLTRHHEPNIHDWVSDEDQKSFRPLLASHQVVIMGRNTYEAIRPQLQLNLPIKRIVLTSNPQQFSDQTVAERLAFSNESSTDVVKRLGDEKVEKVLIVGGPQIISELLGNQLIDYFFVTIEPRLFGQGTPLLDTLPIDTELRLMKCEQLNKQGTLLLQYKVDKTR
jgi:dihydrofolate reductase